MNKKVLLVKPPEKSLFNFGTFSLGVLAAAIRYDAAVKIIDATDMPLHEATTKVLTHEPSIIGITVMGMQSVLPCVDFIKYLKMQELHFGDGMSQHASIIVGGHGATMVPAPLLQAGADYVVVGEGEVTFQEIIERGLGNNIPGTARLVDGSVNFGPARTLITPLDRLRPPARNLMPSPPNGVHLMETSRGCPHDCFFCETTRFNGRRWRPLSPERVVDDIKRLVDEGDAWVIHFADDNFAASTKRLKSICEMLQGESLPAFFMASARADDLVADPELLPLMAASRMLRITVGIETLDLDLAKMVGKPIAPDIYFKAFTKMRELGIFSIASLIVGLPGETRRAREKALDLAVEVGPDSAHFLPFQPQPGIPLSEKRNGYDPDPMDIRDAELYNRLFFQHPTVQARLKAMAKRSNIQGLLARSSLKNPLHKYQ